MQMQLTRALHKLQALTGAMLESPQSAREETPFVDDPRFITRGNPSFAEHDRLGYRNAFLPRSPQLAVLGDSQVYGARIAPNETWPVLTGKMAKAEVYNCAVPGWGGLQYALAMDEVLRLRPAAVLICPYLGNDVFESWVHARQSDAPLAKTLLGRDTEALPLPDGSIHAATEQNLRSQAAQNPDLDAAQLIALCSLRGVANFHHARIGKAEFYLTEHSRTPFEDLDQPTVAAGFRVLCQALAHARDAALAAGAAFAVMPIPTREYLVWLRRDEAELQRPDVLERHGAVESRLLGALTDFCRNRAIRSFDPSAALARSISEGAYFQHSLDGHPSPKGARVIADFVHQRVLPELRQAKGATLYPLY